MSPVSEEKIVELVDTFYVKVRRDPVLGPVFEQAIAAEEWPAHLGKMYDFWSSVMLTTGRYKGNPMMAHMKVAGIEEGLFPRWLALFVRPPRSFAHPRSPRSFARNPSASPRA